MSGSPRGSPPRRTFPAARTVTLTAVVAGRTQALTLSGREASMLVELALVAHTIRPLEHGKVVLDFTPTKVTLSITQSIAPVHLEG